MSDEGNEKLIGIRVSIPLVTKIIELNKWTPDMPAVYAVDSALREYIDMKEAEVK